MKILNNIKIEFQINKNNIFYIQIHKYHIFYKNFKFSHVKDDIKGL
jgi:hypothetical protein